MPIGSMCSRVVATAAAGESVTEAARRMKEYCVGTLIVTNESKHPEGIVTDRDLVVRCLAASLDPDSTRIGDVMSSPVRSGHEAMPLDEALESMQAMGARRLAVTGDDGELVGVLSLDDVVDRMVEDHRRIGAILAKQGRAVLAGR